MWNPIHFQGCANLDPVELELSWVESTKSSQFSPRERDNKRHYVNNKKTQSEACDRLNIQESA